jgi:putative tricarboxylic transport membrane protein
MDAKRREKSSSLFWLIFSILFCAGSLKYSLGTFHQPGPGFFPFLSGTILGCLSLANLFRKVIRTEDPVGNIEALRFPRRWRNIVITLGVLFAYPLLLRLIGFLPSTFLFFVILLRSIEPRRWAIALGGAAAGAVLFYIVFQYCLRIEFPIGIFRI